MHYAFVISVVRVDCIIVHVYTNKSKQLQGQVHVT